MCQFTGKNVSNILAPLKSNIILQHFVDIIKLIYAVTKKGSRENIADGVNYCMKVQ